MSDPVKTLLEACDHAECFEQLDLARALRILVEAAVFDSRHGPVCKVCGFRSGEGPHDACFLGKALAAAAKEVEE